MANREQMQHRMWCICMLCRCMPLLNQQNLARFLKRKRTVKRSHPYRQYDSSVDQADACRTTHASSIAGMTEQLLLLSRNLKEAGSAGLAVDPSKIVWTPYHAEREYANYRG